MNHQSLSHNALHTSGLCRLFIAWGAPWMPHIPWKSQRVALPEELWIWIPCSFCTYLWDLSWCLNDQTWAPAKSFIIKFFCLLTWSNNRKSNLSRGWAKTDIGWECPPALFLPWVLFVFHSVGVSFATCTEILWEGRYMVDEVRFICLSDRMIRI